MLLSFPLNCCASFKQLSEIPEKRKHEIIELIKHLLCSKPKLTFFFILWIHFSVLIHVYSVSFSSATMLIEGSVTCDKGPRLDSRTFWSHTPLTPLLFLCFMFWNIRWSGGMSWRVAAWMNALPTVEEKETGTGKVYLKNLSLSTFITARLFLFLHLPTFLFFDWLCLLLAVFSHNAACVIKLLKRFACVLSNCVSLKQHPMYLPKHVTQWHRPMLNTQYKVQYIQ